MASPLLHKNHNNKSAAVGGVKSLFMNQTNDKIDSILRKDRFKRAGILSIIFVCILLVAYFIINQPVGKIQQTEIVGVMQGVQVAQGYGDTSYRVTIKLDTGKLIFIDVDRVALYRKGKKVVLNESYDLDNKRTFYRYLRDGS
jgi:hypothetical protein